MRWNTRAELKASRVTHGVMAGLVLMGVLIFVREIPAMRRYFRMERM